MLASVVPAVRRILVLTSCVLASTARADTNLIQNNDFEQGQGVPAAWRTFPESAPGLSYVWADGKSHSGRRSACVTSDGGRFAMWRQVVDVEPGRVYELTGYAAFDGIEPPGRCNLQVVFRDANDRVLDMIGLPSHTGSRGFALDYPSRLKVRAPAKAVRAEINLFLAGRGKAWFDDVFFGPVATGTLAGVVTCAGEPLPGAGVRIWGDPWGRRCEARTDAEGRYTIADVPVAFPRYILIAGKDRHRSRAAGDIAVKPGASTAVDFDLPKGADPPDLRVKFGTLSLTRRVRPARIPTGAVIPADASGYPASVRVHLESDACIQWDHPDVRARAARLLAALPAEERRDTAKVAWAVCEWMTKYIEHDGVFAAGMRRRGHDLPYTDVTSGIWQTISPNGWSWGRSFYDWCYRPNELLKVHSGICVERAWLASALLRALNIPSRATTGASDLWAQTPDGRGCWVLFVSRGGRASYRQSGRLGDGIAGGQPFSKASVRSRPILHEDWSAKHKGLWRERHPWRERYQGGKAGYKKALDDLTVFTFTGEAPRGEPRRRHGGRPARLDLRALEQGRLTAEHTRDCYELHYSDVTINLFNIGDQRLLDVRFPLITTSDSHECTGQHAFWTNQPKCVKRKWIEEIRNPPAEGVERWYHIEFDLTPILDASPGRP